MIAMEEVDLDEAASLGQSPKVSTTGTFEDQKNDHSQQPAQPSLQGRSLHDHHHWSDVPRFPGEKSVTSSVGVERDESVADAVEVEEGTHGVVRKLASRGAMTGVHAVPQLAAAASPGIAALLWCSG
jgi:hypothetical protein